MKIRYKLSYILLPLLLLKNKFLILLNKNIGNVRILMFHNIPEKQVKHFDNLISYLNRKYQIIYPKQFKKMLNGELKCKGTNILISFDDGFLSNKKVADRILIKYNIKAIFFIASDFIGLKNKLKQDFVTEKLFNNKLSEKYDWSSSAPMSWQDLNDLLQQNHSIGCHTQSHSYLSEIKNTVLLQKEIVTSKTILETKLNIEINSFAYPFGDITSISKEALDLIKSNYSFCFSAIRGFNTKTTNKYGIFRDDIDLNAPTFYTRFVIEGGLDFFYKKARKKLIKML